MKPIFLFIALSFYLSVSAQNKIAQIEHVDSVHGIVIRDPFHWIENVHSSKVLKFVREENRNVRKAVKKTKQLAKGFLRKMHNVSLNRGHHPICLKNPKEIIYTIPVMKRVRRFIAEKKR